MIVEREHRCQLCNKVVRFEPIKIEDGKPVPDLQVFDEICDKCLKLEGL